MATSRRMAASVAVVALAAFGLAACKSSGSGSQADGSTSSGTANGSSTGANDGKEIRLMVNVPITGGPATGGIAFPYGANAAKAAAKAINATGGVGGRKIVIDVCDNKDDPNASSACGRTAQQNGDVAVIGSFDPVGAPALMAILEHEDIPYIGALSGSPQELTSKISFQFDGGGTMGAFGAVSLMVAEGCKSGAQVGPSGIAGALNQEVKEAFATAGVKYQIVTYMAGQPDLTAPISQVLSTHPDCVLSEGPGPDVAKLIAGIRKTGSKVKFFTAVGSLVPPILAALGKTADGIYAVNTTLLPTENDPMVAKFRSDLIAMYGAKSAATNYNEFGQDGWSSVQLIKDAATNMPSVTGPNLIAKLGTMNDVTVGNVKDHLDFTKDINSKIYPRLFDTYLRYFTAKDGKYVDLDDQWHNAAKYVP